MEFEMNDALSVPQDSTCYMRSGWICDFHFGYGLDVIEEDALNEKFCIQVLRIMIRKADTEIDELEKDLVFLQSELAWAEYDEWSQVCCNTLKKKFDNLYITVRNLGNKDKDDVEVSLLRHRKPAKKVHEIVKTLLNDYFQEKDKQTMDVAVLGSSDPSEHEAELLEESSNISDSDSYAIAKEEVHEPSISPEENSVILKTSLMFQEKKVNLSETVKPINAAVKDSDSNACRHETDLNKGLTTMWKPDLKVVRNEEVITRQTTSTAGVKILESPSNPEGKVNPPNVDKPAKIILHKISNDALSLRHSTGLSGKRNNSDSRLATSRQAKGENSDIRLHVLKHVSGLSGRRSSSDSRLATSRKEKVGNSDVSPNALQHATDPCERRSNLDSVLTTVRQFKVGRCDISPTLGYTTALNRRRNYSDSSLSTLRQAEGRYCDMEHNLCDFAHKSVHKWRIKELNYTLTDKIDSSYSSSEVKEKLEPSQRTVKFEKDGLIYNEDSVLTSFLELKDEKDATREQSDGGKVQLEQVQMAENAAVDETVDLGSSVKRQKLKAKKRIESNPLSVHDRGFHSIELVSNSSLISKAKRQWKSGFGSDSSSNHYLDRDAMKKISDYPCETEGAGAALDDSQILISKPQKKRKKNLSLPILVDVKGSTVETDLSISHCHSNDSAGKDDLSITASYSIDSCTEAVASSCFATSKLKNMKVGDLRMIAKEQKLTKYSKLRKSELIEQIVNHLGCC